MVDGQLLINIIFGCGPSGHQNMRMGGEGVMGAGDYLHLSIKNKDWNVKICLFNKKYWRQLPNISHLIHLFESVELSTLVLIHTKQCLVHNYFIFQNMYILCKFKFKFSIVCFTVYPIFWDILVSTHEGVKTMYIFLHQHYARSCILRVSHLKTARPMHFLVDPLIHLTCLVWWKRNM